MRTRRKCRPTLRVVDTTRRRRVVDTLLVVACLALTALAVKTPWSTLPRPVIAVAGVLGSAAQWYRLRWPHLSTGAGAVAYALSGNPGPLLVGLYSGVAHGSRGQAWALGLVGWAGFAAWSWLDAGRLAVSDAVYAAAAAVVVVGAGLYTATQRERAELREEQARAAERTRIAGEMHDVVAHKVSLIALYAGALELHAGDNTRFREGTALIRSTAREALRELRSVLGMLRAEAHPHTDLASLVEASVQAGQPVELRDEANALPPATARVVYRVVQEGLTNAHKHAPGARTTVSLTRTDGSVNVIVHNEPGVPLDLPGAGAGLVGLAERLRLVGGELRSGPADGGWELHATVPCIGDDAP